ncbi:hypothetical protein HY837_01790, partial [archaeon]|nr:hypothetical protein [archaeon]
FKNFTKTLVDQVLNPKYVVNHDDKDFKSGEAIITKEGFKFKKGTVGVVKDNCPTHKGNILFTPQEFAEECIPKETLLKLENLLDQVVPVEGKPKVGDLVVITKGGGYTVTRDGSWGYVREINDYKAEIEFHHLTGDKRTVPQSFPIENDHFRKAELKKGKKKEIIGKQYLRKGDVVKLRKESEFAAQNKDEGKIIDIDLFNEEFPYMVEFKDGYENNYGEKDLEIANKKSTRAKEITKQKEQDEKKNNTDLEEKTRLTIAVNIIVDEETGKVKEAREKNEKTVKDSLEQLIDLGITKEIAHFFVKKHLRNYVSFVDAGILISDEEEQKFFNKIKDLAVKVHGKEAFYNDLAQKICKEIEQKYDLILAREKITNEKEFNVFKENIGEIFYNNSYNKAPKGKVKEPGLVVVVKDGENVPLGTVGVLENTEVCGGCGYYHYFVPVDGMQTKVAPESIRRVEKLFPLVEEGEIKKGAKVKIRKDSQFYGQADGPGKVKNNFGEEGDIDNEPGAKVVFDNGYQNTYRKKDLELVNPVVVDPVLYAKKQEIINRELPTLKKIVENQTPKADDNEQKLADLFFSVKSELETLGFTNQTVKEYVYEKIGDRAYRNLMALGFVE